MSAVSQRTTNRAKTDTTCSFGNRERALGLNASLMRRSRDLFRIKTAHHLSEITGYSVRACENWLSERVVVPSDALALLLQSEWGREFLSIVMAETTPRWWKQLKAWIGAVDYALAEKKLRRKRKELLDEIEYEPVPTASQMFFDEDFNGSQVAPSRRAHRALAPKKR